MTRFFSFDARTALYRQLQHRRALTYAKMRQQHDLAIGKFKRIMVRGRIFQVDVSEPSHLVNDCLAVALEKAEKESRRLTLDLIFEYDLSARY